MSTMTKVMPATVKALGARTFETIITTGSVDRERDVIAPAGWKLDAYMRSPVVLWAHDYTMPPVAKALSITRTATGLKSVDQFPPPGIYPFADQVHDLVKAGMVRAKSVGFIPLRKTWNATREGWDIHEAELLEHSYVSVPANPEALVVGSKGLDPARLAAFLGSATRGLGEDIGLELIPYNADAIRRVARGAALPRGAEVLDEEDCLPRLTSQAVVGMVGAIVRQEVARRRAGRGIARDGLRGDGKRYNARTGVWESWL